MSVAVEIYIIRDGSVTQSPIIYNNYTLITTKFIVFPRTVIYALSDREGL